MTTTSGTSVLGALAAMTAMVHDYEKLERTFVRALPKVEQDEYCALSFCVRNFRLDSRDDEEITKWMRDRMAQLRTKSERILRGVKEMYVKGLYDPNITVKFDKDEIDKFNGKTKTYILKDKSGSMSSMWKDPK